MKPIIAILAGHHGIGTGASSKGRDEWALARGDALELYLQLARDGIVTPVLEPIAEDDSPGERNPRARSAKWALAQKVSAAIEIHYDSFEKPTPHGHHVCSNRLTPFVEAMARALDTLPNPHRDTQINVEYEIPRLMDPIPCVLLEPAFIFEPIVGTPEWRPTLVAAIKQGVYAYFAGEEMHG
jgi:N-acetylmuramoyl-L-alanine amidase